MTAIFSIETSFISWLVLFLSNFLRDYLFFNFKFNENYSYLPLLIVLETNVLRNLKLFGVFGGTSAINVYYHTRINTLTRVVNPSRNTCWNDNLIVRFMGTKTSTLFRYLPSYGPTNRTQPPNRARDFPNDFWASRERSFPLLLHPRGNSSAQLQTNIIERERTPKKFNKSSDMGLYGC